MNKKLVIFCAFLISTLIFNSFALANDATLFYITDTIGNDPTTVQTSADSSGSGWSWNSSDKVLTLDGFNGEYLEANGDLKVVLKGENTFTIAAESTKAAINLTGYTLTIDKDSSDTIDKLIINGADVRSQYPFKASTINVLGGTIEENISILGGSSSIYGIWTSSYLYARGSSNIIVNIEGKENHSQGVTAISSLCNYTSGDVNVTAKSNSYVTAIGSLTTKSYDGSEYSRGITTLSAETNSTNTFSYAFQQLGNISNVGTINCVKGAAMIAYSGTSYASIPEEIKYSATNVDDSNCTIMFINVNKGRGKFVVDKTTMLPIEDGVSFVPQSGKAALEFISSDYINIASGSVGNRPSNGLTNASTYYIMLIDALKGVNSSSSSQTFKMEILSGALPAGCEIEFNRYIDGTFSEACEAGTATIRVTRLSDNATADVTINYGAVTEVPKYLTIDGSSINIKEDNSGTGWIYTSSTNTLELSGYNGGPIYSEEAFDLNIVLNGENIITMSSDYDKAIWLGNSNQSSNYTIDKKNNDETDKLIIKGTNVQTTYIVGTYGILNMKGGTLEENISINNTSSKTSYGIWSSQHFEVNDAANVSVNIETDDSYTYVEGISSLYFYGTGNVSVNVTGNLVPVAISNLSTATYDNSKYATGTVYLSAKANSENTTEFAIEGFSYLSDKCTITTGDGAIAFGMSSACACIPEKLKLEATNSNDDDWIIHCIYYGSYTRYMIVNKDDGKPITTGMKFIPSDENVALKFIDSNALDIQGGLVGEKATNSLYAAQKSVSFIGSLRGVNENKSTSYTVEIVSGDLPAGLSMDKRGISGTFEVPGEAGIIELKVTRLSDMATANVTINYGTVSVENPVQSIALDKSTNTLNIGDTFTLGYAITPNDASIQTVKWTSSDSKIASVDSTGKVTVNAAGKATITVTTDEGSKTSKCDVYVREATPVISIDYANIKLSGFTVGKNYLIHTSGESDTTLTASETSIDIEEAWLDSTLYIYALNDEEICKSLEDKVIVPAQLSAPTGLTTTATSAVGASDGKINSIDISTMEVSTDNLTWKAISSNAFAANTYYVRYKSTETSFPSIATTVVVAEHEHSGTLVAKVEATGESTGKQAYYTCSCGKKFEDADCTIEIEDFENWGIIPKLSDGLKGDADGNGVVDSQDLTVLAKHVANIVTITDSTLLKNSDVSNNEIVNSEDLTILAKYVARIILEF